MTAGNYADGIPSRENILSAIRRLTQLTELNFEGTPGSRPETPGNASLTPTSIPYVYVAGNRLWAAGDIEQLVTVLPNLGKLKSLNLNCTRVCSIAEQNAE